MKTYDELITKDSFLDRVRYLKLNNAVGAETFGYERRLNQILYKSPEWRALRRKVIIRDNGCDLGIENRAIGDKIIVHHINPITIDDVLNRRSNIFDMNNLICCSNSTHQAIHYGDEKLIAVEFTERSPNDTCPWRNDNGREHTVNN